MAGDDGHGDSPQPDLARTFRFLMATQFLARGVPFLFNIWLVRHLTHEEFARLSVEFQLFMSIIFAFSRDGIRRACMRADIQCCGPQKKENASRLLQIAWISFPLGLVVTLAVCTGVFWWKDLNFSNSYAQAFLIHGFACILELLAEPAYILAQNMLLLKLRLLVEIMATTFRCLTICALLAANTERDKSTVVALSQASYAAFLVVGYWGYFFVFEKFNFDHLFPFRIHHTMNRDRELSSLWKVFTFQSFRMFLLQEGEKMVLMKCATPYNQAVYSLVEKLGSLVVRLVFLPFEESSYSTFAKLASAGEIPQGRVKLRRSLEEALKIIVLIGLLVSTFGPSYSYALLRLLYGRTWCDGEAPTMLRYYCLYVVILAMNGTSEAFLHAVADKQQLQQSNNFLVACSVVYVVLNVLLIQSIGAVGSVMANSINMIMRIVYSSLFIKYYFQDGSTFSFRRCLPSGWELLLLSGLVTAISDKVFLNRENFWMTLPIHVSIGLVCLVLSSVVICRKEKPFIRKLIQFREHAD